MTEELQEIKKRLGEVMARLDVLLGKPQPTQKSEEGVRTVQRNGKNFVEIDNRDWFLETCLILKNKPGTESRDVEALTSLPSGLNKYGSLTEGQWKLFKALHFKIMGTWPEPTNKAVSPVSAMTTEELDSIPF